VRELERIPGRGCSARVCRRAAPGGSSAAPRGRRCSADLASTSACAARAWRRPLQRHGVATDGGRRPDSDGPAKGCSGRRRTRARGDAAAGAGRPSSTPARTARRCCAAS
jgi:hypothetical protein